MCRGASAAPAADPASDSGGETIRDRDLGSEAAQISVPGRLSDQDLIRADITTRTLICHSSITVKHLHLKRADREIEERWRNTYRQILWTLLAETEAV